MTKNQILNFNQFLVNLDSGKAHDDLTDFLREVVASLENQAQEHGIKARASINLKVDFKREDGVIEARASVDCKLPKRPAGKSIFWATPENNLTSSNPKQTEMFVDVNKTPKIETVN